MKKNPAERFDSMGRNFLSNQKYRLPRVSRFRRYENPDFSIIGSRHFSKAATICGHIAEYAADVNMVLSNMTFPFLVIYFTYLYDVILFNKTTSKSDNIASILSLAFSHLNNDVMTVISDISTVFNSSGIE